MNSNVITIRNFHKVTENYYRGAQPKSKEYRQLARLGIKTIINLRRPILIKGNSILSESAIANNIKINYINIPMQQRIPPGEGQIAQFFSIIDNPNNWPVFVHCDWGDDRTGLMTALYRIRNCGWNFNQAYLEMKACGYHHFLYPKLKRYLYDYAKAMGKL